MLLKRTNGVHTFGMRFAIDVAGRRCLDAGASTGGFTDCLLKRGALEVVAVDVAHGKMDSKLQGDPRVTLLERTNVRSLDRSSTNDEGFDIVVADLSFISLTLVMGVLADRMANYGADLLFLVKPQFEVGRELASRGRGVVKDQAARRAALGVVADALVSRGAKILDAMASPLLGPSGNAEFFLHARAHALPRPVDLDRRRGRRQGSGDVRYEVGAEAHSPSRGEPAGEVAGTVVREVTGAVAGEVTSEFPFQALDRAVAEAPDKLGKEPTEVELAVEVYAAPVEGETR